LTTMAHQSGRNLDFTAGTSTSSSVECNPSYSTASPLHAELIERVLNGGVSENASSSSSSFSLGAPAQDEGLSELSQFFHEQQELAMANRALRETCAEWISAIRQVLSQTREVTAERERLLQHVIRYADDDPLLQWVRMSEEGRASPHAMTISDLLSGDVFASLLESTAVSAGTFAPEQNQVPSPRLSSAPESRPATFVHEARPSQTAPMTSFNQSPAAMEPLQAREIEQADLALLMQQGNDRQGEQPRERQRQRRRRRRRRAEAPNVQNSVPPQHMAQTNRERAQALYGATYTQHQFLNQASHPSSRRQLGRRRDRHNSHLSVIRSAGLSIRHGDMFVADILPTAAAAA